MPCSQVFHAPLTMLTNHREQHFLHPFFLTPSSKRITRCCATLAATVTMNVTECEKDVCDLCIIMDDKVRTGPSLCYQDSYLAPLYVVAIGLLLARRARALNAMTPTSDHLKYWEKKDFIITAVLVLHSLYGFLNVAGGDAAEDNTVSVPASPVPAPYLACICCGVPGSPITTIRRIGVLS